MKRLIILFPLMVSSLMVFAQYTFRGTSLSEALIELDKSSQKYDVLFVYDELEDFLVTKTVRKGRSLPDAVRDVCGFYPVRVQVLGHEIYVECLQKERTKLTGKITDSQQQPIPYANITLFHLSDTVVIGGGVSNEDGDFVIPCAAERARVRISCIGFKTIDRVMPVSQVGNIRMQTENYHLGPVMVSGRSSIIHNEAGGLHYVVANDPFARGQSALELLNRVPSVMVTDGRVSILGKGTARLMLNGRMVEHGDEILQQRLWSMRAEDIERIEVVSIPSGRYQTDAGYGYINIVMKRDETTGWRGDLTGQLASSDDWSSRLGGNLNYASKKIDISLGVDGGRATSASNRSMEYLNTYQRQSDSRQESLNKDIRTNLMLRYQPHHRLELGTFVTYQSQKPSSTIDNMQLVSSYQIRSRSIQDPHGNHSISLTAYGDWKMDDMGKTLSLTYNYYNKVDDYLSNVSGEFKERTIQDSYQKMESLLNESGLRYKIHSFKLDLSLPFKPIQLDAGVGYTKIDNKSSCILQVTDLKPHIISNVYQEKTVSAYLSAHKQWDGLMAKAALRYEHTTFDGENWLNHFYSDYLFEYNIYQFLSPWHEETGYNQSLDRLLPSLSLNYHTRQGHQWGVQWGMSILRPNFYDLNPTRNYTSPIDYSAGSPHLMPSYSNSIELNYHNRKGLNMVAYYQHGSNQVEWNSTVKFGNQENTSTSETMPRNCFNADRTGISLNYQLRPTNQLNILAESDVYYYDAWLPTDMERLGVHGWGGKFGLSTDLFLNPQRTLMFSARYNQWLKHYVGLTRFDSYSRFYFALRYSMLNDRLRLSLVADDPFHQHITDAESYYERRLERNHVNHHSHSIALNLSYSFGGKTVRRAYRDKKDTETQRAIKERF